MLLEYIQCGDRRNLFGQPVHSAVNHTVSKFFLIFKWKFLFIGFALCLLAYCLVSLRRAWVLLALSFQILADIGEVKQSNSGIKLIHHCPAVSGILKNRKIGFFLTRHKVLGVLK